VKITAGTVGKLCRLHRVKYGRSDCLAMALNQLFGIPGGGYGGYSGGGAGYSAADHFRLRRAMGNIGGGGYGARIWERLDRHWGAGV